MSIIERLKNLKDQDPEGFKLLQQLAQNAKNSELTPEIRVRCAVVLGDVLTPLMLDSFRDELIEGYKENPSGTIHSALNELTPTKPEYQYIRGARVKVR